MKKVAITGGIACGKSLVCDFLREEGAHVVDADQIVHQLLTPETALSQRVVELLGLDVLVDGKIDRAKVANKVFSNPEQLNSLENLLHPHVYEEIEKLFEEVQRQPRPPLLFVAEVPLLFESKGEQYFDYTVAVVSDLETCRKRYQNQKGKSLSDFERRAARQMAVEKKANKADFIIENRDSLKSLRQQTQTLFHRLINEETHPE